MIVIYEIVVVDSVVRGRIELDAIRVHGDVVARQSVIVREINESDTRISVSGYDVARQSVVVRVIIEIEAILVSGYVVARQSVVVRKFSTVTFERDAILNVQGYIVARQSVVQRIQEIHAKPVSGYVVARQHVVGGVIESDPNHRVTIYVVARQSVVATGIIEIDTVL
jgi:hypothetical protein